MPKSREGHRRARKQPYDERPDLDKLQAQWNKLSGLHLREEPSAAIVRCATAAEIAANYAIRREWGDKTQFDDAIVNKFLRWANGLQGKIDRLFVPIYFANEEKSRTAKLLRASAKKIHDVRNEIVHQGRFSDPDEATAVIAEAKTFIDTIVGLSQPGFDIQHSAVSDRSD
jgi:hypothetical protein